MRINVLTIILADAKYKNKNEMDTLYLLQFACFLFMFINILILGVAQLGHDHYFCHFASPLLTAASPVRFPFRMQCGIHALVL